MTERPRRTTPAVLLLALAGLLALGACSGPSDAVSDSAAVAEGVGSDGVGSDTGGAQAAPDPGVPGAPVAADAQERAVSVTADISVRSDDIAGDADRAVAVAGARGGLVTDDVRRGGEDRFAYADLTLRVSADTVDTVLDELAGLGVEIDRSVTSTDVTAVVADVDARVQSLQDSLDRLRSLFGQAADVPDLVALEQEIAQRQEELEAMQARQRALADEVALASVSVHLRATDVSEALVTDPDGFLDGLEAGLSAFVTGVRAVLVTVGAVLPFAVAAAAVVVPVLLVRRRRRRPVEATPAAS